MLTTTSSPDRHTDRDLRALIDSANAATLENIAEELAENRDPDELHASVQLEGIAYAPPRQLYDTLEFARKGLRPSRDGRGRPELADEHLVIPATSAKKLVGPGGTMRVAVGRPGRRSGIWRIWAPSNKPEVYVKSSDVGELKLSLHGEQDCRSHWHYAFERAEQAIKHTGSPKRWLDDWDRPEPTL